MTWDGIDSKAKTIEVNRQVQWHNDKTGTDIKEKNGTAEAYYDEYYRHYCSKYPLTTGGNEQYTSKLNHEKLGMPQWDFRSSRHTHAAMLPEQGVPLVYLQKRLGHKSLNVTSDVYTNHLTETMKSQGDEVKNLCSRKRDFLWIVLMRHNLAA